MSNQRLFLFEPISKGGNGTRRKSMPKKIELSYEKTDRHIFSFKNGKRQTNIGSRYLEVAYERVSNSLEFILADGDSKYEPEIPFSEIPKEIRNGTIFKWNKISVKENTNV